MKFKDRNLRALAECVIGDNTVFLYRSSDLHPVLDTTIS